MLENGGGEIGAEDTERVLKGDTEAGYCILRYAGEHGRRDAWDIHRCRADPRGHGGEGNF